MDTWDQIKKAVESINLNSVKRVDGDGWTVYAVGSNIIRIDIKTKT
jgi:hypothetical protein